MIMLRKIVIFFSSMIMCTVAYGDATTLSTSTTNTQIQRPVQCLIDIGNDEEAFVNILKSEIVKNRKFDQTFVDKEKEKIYGLVASNIVLHCLDVDNLNDFNHDIVDPNTLDIPFKMDNLYYILRIDVATLFEYINLPVGIMVVNKDLQNKRIGDVITEAETPSDYVSSAD